MGCFLLTLMSCQPYVDHEVRLFNFEQDFSDFGPKRKLELLEVRGDTGSLTLIFNQPLRLPDQTDVMPPFEVELTPSVPILRSEYVGVAGVKIIPEKGLPFGTRYEVSVPSGWRAPTGAAMLRGAKMTWSTPRPIVVEVSNGGPVSRKDFDRPILLSKGKGLRLIFNQPISYASLKQLADWRAEVPVSGKPLPFRLQEVESASGPRHTEFLFEPESMEPGVDYRLTVRAGLKGLQGPLRGGLNQSFLLRSPRALEYTGPRTLSWSTEGSLELNFSTKVSVEEVERSVVAIPWRRPFQVTLLETPSSAGAFRAKLRWKDGRAFPYALRILRGLKSVDGRVLEADVNLPIQEISALPNRPPLVPLLYGAMDGSLGLPPEARRVKTWRVSLREALRLSCSEPSEWAQGSPLAIEARKPVFDSEKETKAKTSEPGLKPVRSAAKASGHALRAKEPAYGFFLVKAEHRDAGRRRALTNRTELELHALTEEGGVRVIVRGRATRRPVQNVKVALWTVSNSRSHGVRVSEETVTDRNGEAFLKTKTSAHGSDVRFVVASKGKDSHFVPLENRKFSSEALPPAYVTSDKLFYRPGESVRFSGFSWEVQTAIDSLLGQGTVNVEVFDLASGNPVFSSTVPLDGSGTFEAAWEGTSSPGLYRAVFSLPGHSLSVRCDVRVSPLANPGEKCQLVLSGEGPQRTVSLSNEAGFYRTVGLRAYLLPPQQATPARSGQWVATSGLVPFWLPLKGRPNQTPSTYDLTIPPEWNQGGSLVIEAFDESHPDQVLCRQVEELSGVQSKLILEAEGQNRVGSRQTLRFVPSSSGISEDGRVSWESFHRPRGTTSPWKLLDSGVVGTRSKDEVWSVRFEKAGEYLLTARNATQGDQGPEQTWEILVPAEPTLGLRPSEVYPGDRVEVQGTERLKSGSVWVELRGGGVSRSFLRDVGSAADLGSLIVTASRSREQQVRVVKLETPTWGRQRASWVKASGHLSLLGFQNSNEMRMSLERGDGLEGSIRSGGVVNVDWVSDQTDVWTGFLNWRAVLPGWPSVNAGDDVEESYFGSSKDVPSPLLGRYPVLDSGDNMSFMKSGLQVGPSAELSVSAPKVGGQYHARFVARDYRGRFRKLDEDFEVEEVSTWRALTPVGVRQGDRFSAGPEFFCSDTEQVAVGLTIAAESSSNLMPETFLGTAGIVKPGKSKAFLFAYELDEADAKKSRSQVSLDWEVGRQGVTEIRTAQVPVWRHVQVPSDPGLSVLNTGQTERLRLNGERPWRLDLYPPNSLPEAANSPRSVETVVSVAGPDGGLGKVRLQPGMQPVSLQGSAPGSLHLTLLRGPSIAYRVARLREDQGDVRPWGADIYLLRSLVKSKGQPDDVLTLGRSTSVVLSMVVPKTISGTNIRLPLPGGLRPLGVEMTGRQGVDVPWTFESGSLQFDSGRLEPGEYSWTIPVDAICPGDYLWPTAQALDATGRLMALSGSGRVVIGN